MKLLEMNNQFPEKIIVGSVEVFPDINREEAIPVLERVFGINLEERDANEYTLYEAEKNGVSYQLALNFDWNLDEAEKQSIEVHITSYWEDRENIPESDLSFILKGIPCNLSENEYGHIIISEFIAELLRKRTGYRCEIEENET